MTTNRYSFDGFQVDVIKRLLLYEGKLLPLKSKTFDLLLVLIENCDRLLTKEEIIEKVWAGQFVEEANLPVHIHALRKALGEGKDEHRFIVTVSGRGYRFVAQVELISANPAENEKPSDYSETEDFASDKKTEQQVNSVPKSARQLNQQFLFWSAAGTVLLIGLAAWWIAWRGEQKPEIGAKHLKLTRLTTSGKVTNVTLSPDGRFVVFAQSEDDGQSLWLRQVDTGSQTRIVEPQAVDYIGLTVSPDNSFIYYSVFQDNKADTFLKRMPLLGGAAEEVLEVETGVAVSFAPDGKQFAFTQASSGLKETYLKIAETNGANQRTLVRANDENRSFQDFKANPVAWSPDSAEIACAVKVKNANGTKAGILLINSTSGDERLLLGPRFAFIENLAWIDADNLAFVGYENDEWSSQIWVISRQTGGLRQITNDLHKYLWLAAAQGTLLTVQQNETSALQIADFAETDKMLRPHEVLRETGINHAVFAKDNSILYTSRVSGKNEIWRVHLDGTGVTQVTADAQISYGFSAASANGEIVFSSARGGRNSLWTVDAAGKNFRQLTENADDIYPQFSADGQSVIFERGLSDVPTVWRTGTNGDAVPVQITNRHSLKPVVSLDGTQAAYYFMDFETDGAWRIGLVSTETGKYLGKLNFPTFVSERRMRWHPSGKFLTLIFNTGENANLLLLPVDGGEARTVTGLGKGKVNSFDWSRDGKQIVIALIAETRDVISLKSF